MGLYNFSWVIEDELAAMAWPHDPARAGEELQARGIEAVVNLSRRRWPADALHGVDYLWLPVPDFGVPSREQVDRFVRFCDESIAAGRAVAVHCLAGRGRTGTLVACYMVHRGAGAEEAIGRIRRLRPGSIETAGQEQFVRRFADRGE